MKNNEEEYKRFAEVMGRSHITPAHPDLLAERITRRVLEESRKTGNRLTMQKFVFGWTSVIWARRSLAFASLLLVCLFTYQQFEIMSDVRDIKLRMKSGGGIEVRPAASFYQGQFQGLSSLTGSLQHGVDSIKVSVDDISKLIESYRELEVSREMIIWILQRNPDILRILEKEYGGYATEALNKSKI